MGLPGSNLIDDTDLRLLAEGAHLRAWTVLGAHPLRHDGVDGTRFAVWAPHAWRVSVVGPFNGWNAQVHPLRHLRGGGVWATFVPGIGAGALYQFEIEDAGGQRLPRKSDPYALAAEPWPGTASQVAVLPPAVPALGERRRANAHDAPIAIYEVHLASWRRKPEEGDRCLHWDELADQLIPYALGLGFTHLQLMPFDEAPADGIRPAGEGGLYVPTSCHGDATGFRSFVARAQSQGLGVLLDFSPTRFPAGDHGLARFDGTALYEQAAAPQATVPAAPAQAYRYGSAGVHNLLLGNALYWLERYGVDGLHLRDVASVLDADDSRQDGTWAPSAQAERENAEAIAFLKRLNEIVAAERPGAIVLAEDSTAFAGLTRPAFTGGLGFHYKWNLGWMHDLLRYFARDPLERQHHHHELTFSLTHAFSDHFVLALPHAEVTHGKGSLLARMPGDRWRRFANLRALYGAMWGHPGKKLLFMGGEFAQERAWNPSQSLDWHVQDEPLHAGMRQLVRDLNRVLHTYPALHQRDSDGSGFDWLEANDARQCVLAFARHGQQDGQLMLVVCNLTPQVHASYRLGVPRPGRYYERLNTDSVYYGGSNAGTPWGIAGTEPVPSHGRTHSVLLTLPPLATVFLEWKT
jgi:1,4-alpha-glucan branching enzyme